MKKQNKVWEITKKALIIIAVVFIVVIITILAIIYFRLKQVQDPNITYSDRESEYSVPLTPPEEDLSKATSYNEDDWDTSIIIPDTSEEESATSTIPIESTTSISNNSSSAGTTSSDYVWVWHPQNVPIVTKEQIDSNVINILILGVDSTNATTSGGRSDTMIVASYNKTTGSINLISLMRDSFVPIEGHDWNRLNTGYFFGGVGLCINTINDVFELDIQNYVMVDFASLPKLIDKIGGIEVTLTQAEADFYKQKFGWNVTAGTVLLNGDQALKHARNRSVGNSDFSRTSRQRDLLQKIINKMINKNDLAGTLSLMNTSLDLIKTNMSPTKLTGLATDVFTGPTVSINTMQMPVNGTYESYWYKQNMLVMKIDIVKNREAIKDLLYN